MKRSPILLFFILLLFLLPVRADGAVPESVQQGVVHLYAVGLDDFGNVRSRWTGTGFAVGIAGEESDVFLTNNHVVTGNGQFDADHMRLWILRGGARLNENRMPETGSGIECTLLGTTSGYPDVAVIRAAEPTAYKALALMSSRSIPDGRTVYSLGFPGLTATDNGSDDLQITTGYITKRLTMQKAGNTRSLIHTARIQHGNSGGPLVNNNGVVVGLNTYGFEENVSTELFCALYTDYAMELLDSLGIAYTQVSGLSPIAVTIMNILYTPAAWAVLVLGVGIVFLGYSQRKLSRQKQE